MSKIKKIKKKAKELKQVLKKQPMSSLVINPNDLIPTGSTIFNLECSGSIWGAFKLGKIVNLIGDSHAGKTLFAFTIFAECSQRKRFNGFDFFFDDVEAANEFNLPYLFGKKCAKRINQSIRSNTIEQFNDSLARLLKRKRPFIYVLDSFDALTSEAAIKKDNSNRKKREDGNKTDGSYGDGKPKKASELFSLRKQEINDHGSFVLIISQTRDNIGFGAQFTPKTRSGGKALKFYSFHEIWLATKKREKKNGRTFSTDVLAKISKNKLTGRHGEVTFPIKFDYGIDDIESCIDFMIKQGSWSGSKKAINTKGFLIIELYNKKETKTKKRHPKMFELISYIEDNDKETDLYKLCQQAYDDIMESLKPKRKRKY